MRVKVRVGVGVRVRVIVRAQLNTLVNSYHLLLNYLLYLQLATKVPSTGLLTLSHGWSDINEVTLPEEYS